MLNILRKTAASMAKSGRSSLAGKYDVVFADDLSTWELVDASPSDDEDLCSFDGDADVISDDDDVLRRDRVYDHDDDVISNEPETKQAIEEDEEEEDAREPYDLGSPDGVIFMESVSVPVTFRDDEMCHDHLYDHDDVDDDGHVYDDDDDDDDVDDDELLAWKLEERFGKPRMKKTGRRSRGSKPDKSKRRLPYSYNRPGCLYGKHGLGVQNSYIYEG